MDWDLLDFAVFGAMLLGAGLIYAFARRISGSFRYRMGWGVAVVSAFLLLWVNAAVGIIGNENNDANLLFFGVLALAAAGAALSRFQSRGMARTMTVTAIAQTAVALTAWGAGWGSAAPAWPSDILFINGFFIALWLVSAWLFRSSTPESNYGDAPIRG